MPTFYVTKPRTTSYFPENGQPKLLILRSRLVEEICMTVVNPHLLNYYIRGAKGSGKSVLLDLVETSLLEKGYDVYKVNTAYAIGVKFPEKLFIELEKSLKKSGKRAFLLVDDAHHRNNSGVWTYLLEAFSHTIGFGTPSLDGLSPTFLDRMQLDNIFLTESDILDDMNIFESIFNHCLTDSNLTVDDTKKVVRTTLCWLLSYTGGHAYPFVKLAEYLLTKHTQECINESWGSVMGGYSFYHSNECKYIRNCSFPFSLNVKVASNGEAKAVKLVEVDVLTLLEIGFESFREYHFPQCDSSSYHRCHYENWFAHYFGWCLSRISNILISPQHIVTRSDMVKCGKKTLSAVDFYLNGNSHTYIKLIQNADVRSLREHFDQLIQHNGKYASRSLDPKCVLVNINFFAMVPVKLSHEYEQYGEHYWSFVRKDNSIWHNQRRVKSNVSKRLKTSSISVGLTNSETNMKVKNEKDVSIRVGSEIIENEGHYPVVVKDEKIRSTMSKRKREN